MSEFVNTEVKERFGYYSRAIADLPGLDSRLSEVKRIAGAIWPQATFGILSGSDISVDVTAPTLGMGTRVADALRANGFTHPSDQPEGEECSDTRLRFWRCGPVLVFFSPVGLSCRWVEDNTKPPRPVMKLVCEAEL